MPHMVPEYTQGRMYLLEGEDWLTADALAAALASLPADSTVTVSIGAGWFARLSAPGYLDCTAWLGPYGAEAEAQAALCAEYDIDADGNAQGLAEA